MKKKVLLRGPVLTRSGYGEQARFALRSLRSKPELYDIYIHPLSWGQTSWVSEYDDEKNMLKKDVLPKAFDRALRRLVWWYFDDGIKMNIIATRSKTIYSFFKKPPFIHCFKTFYIFK